MPDLNFVVVSFPMQYVHLFFVFPARRLSLPALGYLPLPLLPLLLRYRWLPW
jgi:hypothetical protein